MKITTTFVYPPIQNRNLDWSAVFDDYDGSEDSENRGHVGFGPTEATAKADLIENFGP